MTFNLLTVFDFEITSPYYFTLIRLGIILCWIFYNFFRKNNIKILSKYIKLLKNKITMKKNKNIEPFTDEEIGEILKQQSVIVAASNLEMIKAISDSDSEISDSEISISSSSESEIESDYDSMWDSDSSIDTESILNHPNLSFLPNIDTTVCSILELKFFEIKSLYAEELIIHSVSDEEIIELLLEFTEEELASDWYNTLFIELISLV